MLQEWTALEDTPKTEWMESAQLMVISCRVVMLHVLQEWTPWWIPPRRRGNRACS